MRGTCFLLLAVQSCGFVVRTPNFPVLGRTGSRQPAMTATEVDDDLKIPTRVQLIVEPTPFTHVSGYANRFKEYLKYQKKAGCDVSIITPDDTPEAPSSFLDFPITTVRGFRFILYPVISMAWGFAPSEGWRRGLWRRLGPVSWFKRRKNKRDYFSCVAEVVDDFNPEIVHVTSPGFIAGMSTYIAREWKDIPILLSYHTHIPIYSRVYAPWMGAFGEWLSWFVIKQTHKWADLTVVTSPQLREEFLDHGIERVEVWNKGIDTQIFHPKYGAKPWWVGRQATAKKSIAAGILSDDDEGTSDDEKTLTAKALETRTMLTDGHPEAPLLIYVGRLGVEKRLRDLKDVLAKLPEVSDNVLCFPGPGELPTSTTRLCLSSRCASASPSPHSPLSSLLQARLAIVGKGPDMEPLKEHFEGTPTVFTGLVQVRNNRAAPPRTAMAPHSHDRAQPWLARLLFPAD